MTQESWTAKESWSSKHDAFCLAHKLEGAAKLIWQWMVNHPHQQKEPDLGQFNKWAAKHRGRPYHRDTIKIAWAKLIDAGVIHPLKRYTWKIWGIILRSITLLVNPPQPRKNSRPSNCDRDQKASNEQDAAQEVQAVAAVDLLKDLPEDLVSDIEQNLELCEAAGINFDAEDVPQILDLDPEDVRSAIALFYKRGGHHKIPNPEGWIRRCLERRWWESKQLSFAEVLINLAKYLGVNQ